MRAEVAKGDARDGIFSGDEGGIGVEQVEAEVEQVFIRGERLLGGVVDVSIFEQGLVVLNELSDVGDVGGVPGGLVEALVVVRRAVLEGVDGKLVVDMLNVGKEEL